MLVLILHAGLPMLTALDVAVALQKADPGRPLPHGCNSAMLTSAEQPLGSFDGRTWGYGYAQAQTILCAMEANGGEGKRMYLDRHFPLDIVFPLLYGPALAMLFLYLVGYYGWRGRALRYFALVPIAAALFDLAENTAVRLLVLAGPPPDAGLVTIASTLTVIKSALGWLSLIVTLGLLLWYLVTRSLSRDPAA